MKEQIISKQEELDEAELKADRDALDTLLADDFVCIGPKGFLMDKKTFIDRHRHFEYLTIESTEVEVHGHDAAAVVTLAHKNRAVYQGEEMEHTLRMGQTWVQTRGAWRLALLQSSPL
jgi:hypothetical protein